MKVGLIISIIAVLIALFDRNTIKPRKFGGFECAWLMLFVYLAIRYDYGNDYMSYLYEYERYTTSNYALNDIDNLASLQSRGDYGWVIFNKICKPIGFFGMVILLAAIYMGQLYYYIKKYVPQKWYWLCVFMFAFHPTLMVVGVAGMLRQWMVVAIFIEACNFIKKKKIVPYFLLILLATTIHKTAFLLFPVYLIGLINPEKFNVGKVFGVVLFFLIWFIIPPIFYYDLVMPLLANDSLAVYQNFMTNNSGLVGFGISTLIVMGIPILCLSQIGTLDQKLQTYSLLLLPQLLFLPLVPINGLVGRLQVYFFVFSLIVYPNVFNILINKGYKNYLIPIIILIMVYYSYLFITHFLDPVWYETTYYYHTIFEQRWQ